MFESQIERIRNTYHEYPRHFWVLMGASFVDSLGSALLYPFFALYVTRKFGVGLSEVGLIFAALTAASMVGTTLGGGLTDRFGRKPMAIFGLVSSAFSILVLGFVQDLSAFLPLVIFAGLTGNVGGPARSAMIADILPEDKIAGGYGLHRVTFNLSFVIGPALGGFLAAYSYLALFIFDTITSLVTAYIVYRLIPETKPAQDPRTSPETATQTFTGYGRVLKDQFFMFFVIASMLMALVFSLLHGPLSVFLRDVHGLQEQLFGWILSLNATMVVLFQFAISRRVDKYPPFLILTFGTLVLVVGFGMYGFVSTYVLFMVAMAIITIGEMLVAPVGQGIAAKLAPEQMRGRYMAIYGFAWSIPGAIGMYFAGLILDNYDPNWIWYAAVIVGLMAASAFWLMNLHQREPDAAPLAEEPSSNVI
jgi:MFS family permease